jgi:hypothetical protein
MTIRDYFANVYNSFKADTMYKYDIYAAGPFFNPQQKATMDAAINGLRELGFVVCDPRDLNPVLVDLKPEERKALARQIYESNVNAVDASYMVVACIDDRDPGTAYEMGYCAGRIDERHFGFVTFSGFGHGCNVMLSEPSEHHFDYVGDMIDGMKAVKHLVDRREASTFEFGRVWGVTRVKAEATE